MVRLRATDATWAEEQESKLLVGMDCGGTSYRARVTNGYGEKNIVQVDKWPGQSEEHQNLPALVTYDEAGKPIKWGVEAMMAQLQEDALLSKANTRTYDSLKLYLNGSHKSDPKNGPMSKEMAREGLAFMNPKVWCHIIKFAQGHFSREFAPENITVILSVPGGWSQEVTNQFVDTFNFPKGPKGYTVITPDEATCALVARIKSGHLKVKTGERHILCDIGHTSMDYTLVEVVRGESPYEFRELVSGGDFIGSRSISKAMLEMVEEQLGDHPGEGNLREARRWLRHQFISFHIATIDQSEGVLLIQTDPPITISKRQILERVYLPFYAKLLEMYHGRFRTGFGPCTQVSWTGGITGNITFQDFVNKDYKPRLSENDQMAFLSIPGTQEVVEGALSLFTGVVVVENCKDHTKLTSKAYIGFQRHRAFDLAFHAQKDRDKRFLGFAIEGAMLVFPGDKLNMRVCHAMDFTYSKQLLRQGLSIEVRIMSNNTNKPLVHQLCEEEPAKVVPSQVARRIPVVLPMRHCKELGVYHFEINQEVVDTLSTRIKNANEKTEFKFPYFVYASTEPWSVVVGIVYHKDGKASRAEDLFTEHPQHVHESRRLQRPWNLASYEGVTLDGPVVPKGVPFPNLGKRKR